VRLAETAVFFSNSHQSVTRALPASGLCVSRFVLDRLLAETFQELGGELHCGSRWEFGEWGPGIVRATGRKIQPAQREGKWVGIKAHAENVSLEADLEMHLAEGGYVGLCRLSDERVNVCGLFRLRKHDHKSFAMNKEKFFSVCSPRLEEKLKKAEWDR